VTGAHCGYGAGYSITIMRQAMGLEPQRLCCYGIIAEQKDSEPTFMRRTRRMGFCSMRATPLALVLRKSGVAKPSSIRALQAADSPICKSEKLGEAEASRAKHTGGSRRELSPFAIAFFAIHFFTHNPQVLSSIGAALA
jgi:hypothetical protein